MDVAWSAPPLWTGIVRISSRIDTEHLILVDTVDISLASVATAHPGHTAHTGFVIIEPKFAARAGVKTAAPTDVARILGGSRNLIPLKGLKSRVLRKQRSREDKVASVWAIHIGHHKWRRDRLQMLSRLRLLMTDLNLLAIVGLFVQ